MRTLERLPKLPKSTARLKLRIKAFRKRCAVRARQWHRYRQSKRDKDRARAWRWIMAQPAGD